MDFTEFWTICSANSIVLDIDQLKQLRRYVDELLYWNQKVNLISRKDEENILGYHILHSLAPLKYIEIPDKSRCLDVGTGAGLPGIPLAIACPRSHFLLIDSIQKKIKATDMFASHTGIKHLEVKRVRAEELAQWRQFKGHFDFVFARAVAKIGVIAGWVKPMIKPQGRLVFLKGGDLGEEIDHAYAEHKNIEIEEIKLDLFGAEWFLREEKKLVICKFI
ncbi:MAG: 16S rRNA (guanine(527)-N(7))-methyltransferase RsmG [Candidatus Kapaibacterium sp.]